MTKKKIPRMIPIIKWNNEIILKKTLIQNATRHLLFFFLNDGREQHDEIGRTTSKPLIRRNQCSLRRHNNLPKTNRTSMFFPLRLWKKTESMTKRRASENKSKSRSTIFTIISAFSTFMSHWLLPWRVEIA